MPQRYPRGRLGERPENDDAHRRSYHPPLVSRPYPPPRSRSIDGAHAPAATPSDPPPPDLVFIVGRDSTVHYCNRAAAQRSKTDVLGTSLLDYVLKDDRDAARQVLERIFASGESDGFDARGLLPFSEGAWYECRVAPNERDGRVVSATVIARDVTRARTAEHKLRAARDRLQVELDAGRNELKGIKAEIVERGARDLERDRLQAILSDAGEPIMVIDPANGQFVDANETACRWLGRSRGELLTLTSADLELGFVLPVPEQSEEQVAETRAAPRPAMRTGELVRRSDGTSFAVEASVLRRRVTGRDYLLVVLRAVEGTREPSDETAETYRGLFEISHDPMYLTDRDGSIADANPAACRLFGYERDEFLGLPASRLHARPGDIRAFQQAAGAEAGVKDLDVELTTKAGRLIKGQLTVRHRSRSDEGVSGYECVIRPVSQEIAAAAGSPARRSVSGATVLVIDPDPSVLERVTEVLDRAGIPSVTTETMLAAIEVMRPRSGHVGAVLLGVDSGQRDLRAVVSRLHHADSTVPIVLMSDRLVQDDAPDESLPGVVGVVRKPIYPLALVEQVRHALR